MTHPPEATQRTLTPPSPRIEDRRRAPRHLPAPVGLAASGLLTACAPPLDAQTLPELLDAAIDQGLPGIVIAVDGPGSQHDFAGVAGFANLDRQVPMTLDAGFRIASNSKAFVGLALASMHVDGEIDLDRPLGELVDAADLAGIEHAEASTLRQALQHTSGIADYLDGDGFWGAVDRGRTAPWTIRDALAYARDEPASFTPGQGWAYSNTNYLLAGLAMEQASGASWARAIRQRVLDPLGMGQSFVEHGEPPRVDIVHGYSRAQHDMFDVDTGYGLPDGGIVATAPDLLRFIRAVSGGAESPELDPEAVRLMTESDVGSMDGERYGLGIATLDTPCGPTVGHGGNLEGYLSEMYHVPALDLSVVVFVNASDGWVDARFDAIAAQALTLACDPVEGRP